MAHVSMPARLSWLVTRCIMESPNISSLAIEPRTVCPELEVGLAGAPAIVPPSDCKITIAFGTPHALP